VRQRAPDSPKEMQTTSISGMKSISMNCSVDHEFDYSYDNKYVENSGSGRAEDDKSFPDLRVFSVIFCSEASSSRLYMKTVPS